MFGHSAQRCLAQTPVPRGFTISKRIEGTIIWFSFDEGYGIIRQKKDNKTISVEQSQIHYDFEGDVRPLLVGQRVSFVINDSIAQDLYIL